MRSRSGRKAGGRILFVGCGLLAALAGVRAIPGAAAEGDPASAAVTPSIGEPGITETVAQIMAREARARNSCGVGTYGSSQRDTTIPPCP